MILKGKTDRMVDYQPRRKCYMSVIEGEKAPDFKLHDDQDNIVTLESYKGRKLVLYFYPKDDTPGCTAEACDLRDNFKNLDKLSVAVAGVSKDSVASHQKFKAKYDLNFPLLSDVSEEVCHTYGVMKEKSMYGKTYMGIERSTFLIDEQGMVRKAWRGVKVDGHVEEILDTIKDLK
jgi:peroxiredoxin Q/BCP